MASVSNVSMHPTFENQALGTVYGNCIGDAIGLLTEFMPKKECNQYYGKAAKSAGLEYNLKVPDFHRQRWQDGDWTDDSDQMILILDSILANNGEVIPQDYAKRLLDWINHGFPELGDGGGCGIGQTTYRVTHHKLYLTDPHAAAFAAWESSGRFVAPNGAVMRTSILGVYQCHDLNAVKRNTLEICKVTHADPRCQASCIAVTCAIAFMLSRDPKYYRGNDCNGKAVRDAAFQEAKLCFDGCEHEEILVEELHRHMYAKSLKDLKLEEHNKIGYTLKALGAGFWALQQSDFRKALTELVMEGGDADTNGAVAGALLGCKLGYTGLPKSWLHDLYHKEWLDERMKRFLQFSFPGLQQKLLPPARSVDHIENHVIGTLYGHCMADAIGLLTEFMSKQEARQHYSRLNEEGFVELSYDQKVIDKHRGGWPDPDWTDDTDQMILIIDSIIDCNGEVNPQNFGRLLKDWARHGFPELGDTNGVGLGSTTSYVLKHPQFETEVYKAADDIWQRAGCDAAPNGAVMRTSVLGAYKYKKLALVKKNTRRICRITHADPRCVASCVAVTHAIAYMLQRNDRHYNHETGEVLVQSVTEDAYQAAKCELDKKSHKEELKKYMFTKTLTALKLDEAGSRGYTFKALGAGFWALRQQNYKKAITELVMEGGDADTNGAVAGALLGCKLGYYALAEQVPRWMHELKHKQWFDDKINSFLRIAFPDMGTTILKSSRSDGLGKTADVEMSTADAPADVPMSTADAPADVQMSTAGTAADVPISATDTAADVPMSATDTAADVPMSATDTAADVPMSATDTTADVQTDASSAAALSNV